MKSISPKLSEPDCRAVDLLLDQCSSHNGATRHAVGASPVHVKAAEKILKAIGQMPVMEPSADLVTRTMLRISQATAMVQPEAPGQRPMLHAPH